MVLLGDEPPAGQVHLGKEGVALVVGMHLREVQALHPVHGLAVELGAPGDEDLVAVGPLQGLLQRVRHLHIHKCEAGI